MKVVLEISDILKGCIGNMRGFPYAYTSNLLLQLSLLLTTTLPKTDMEPEKSPFKKDSSHHWAPSQAPCASPGEGHAIGGSSVEDVLEQGHL